MAARALEWGVVAVVTATLVATGPLGVVDVVNSRQTTVGDGTASATVARLPAEDLRISPGRFGTDVAYLRLPAATVRVGGIEGRPRLVYRIQVPALDVDVLTDRLLRPEDRGEVTLEPPDVGLERAPNPARARVTVRVQSFEVDRTVYDRNVTVEVADGAR